MDKLKAMQFFCVIADTGSFSAAAKQIQTSVSNLSRNISALEKDTGVELIKRNTRQVKLTEIGNAYLEQCKDILNSINQADSLVNQYNATPSGVLHISALPLYAEMCLLPLIPEFKELYPDIILDIELSYEFRDFVRDNIDILFLCRSLTNERLVADLLVDNRSILCATPEYITTRGNPTTIQELENHTALVFRTPDQELQWKKNVEEEWVPVQIKTGLISNSGLVLKKALLGSDGVGLFPRWSVQPELDKGQLIQVNVSTPITDIVTPCSGLYMLYQSTKYTVPKVKVAIDFFRERLTPNQ